MIFIDRKYGRISPFSCFLALAEFMFQEIGLMGAGSLITIGLLNSLEWFVFPFFFKLAELYLYDTFSCFLDHAFPVEGIKVIFVSSGVKGPNLVYVFSCWNGSGAVLFFGAVFSSIFPCCGYANNPL